jgi:ABC-type sugar transport system permease subunit
MMLTPALVLVALVAIYPLGRTVYDSFTNRQFLEGIEPTEYVGLQNYETSDDTIFRDSVVVTAVHGDHGRLRACSARSSRSPSTRGSGGAA